MLLLRGLFTRPLLTESSTQLIKIQKHQAICAYSPTVLKPPSQALDRSCTNQSSTIVSSQHTQTPGHTDRPRYEDTVNGLVSEHPSEPGDLDQLLWKGAPELGNFDDGLNLMDLVVGTSPFLTESPLEPQLQY